MAREEYKLIRRIKLFITSYKARSEHNKLSSWWSNESRLTQRILISILRNTEEMTELLNDVKKSLPRLKRRKQKPSKYNAFFAEKVKAGLSIQEISKAWKKEKEGGSSPAPAPSGALPYHDGVIK